MIRRVFRHFAKKQKLFLAAYTKLFTVSGEEYAEIIKAHNLFYFMGENCSIIPGTYIGDAQYIRLGNNVRLANCNILAHDGVVNMLKRAYNLNLDAVGKIDIGDNVFIGQGATVLRNCTIGSNSVIAAGAVVTRDVPPNSVVGGVPARFICSTDELVERLRRETDETPWRTILEQRASSFDAGLEPGLRKLRQAHFFPEAT